MLELYLLHGWTRLDEDLEDWGLMTPKNDKADG